MKIVNYEMIFLFFCTFHQKIEPSWRKFKPQTKVKHKFANIQTELVILEIFILRYHSKWRVNTNERGEEDNADPNFGS